MTSNPTLTLANLIATYISAKTMQSPNPPPKVQNKIDRLFLLPGANNPKLGSAIFVILALSHTLLIAKGVTPSSPPTVFFPNPQNLNPKYFEWSTYTKTCLALIGVSGVARLAAYRALGSDFTFELAKPTALKTTGIYHYVQHPSYLPLIVIVTVNMALFGMVDGVMGSWLPSRVVEVLAKWNWVGLGAWVVAWCGVIAVRVKDEEDMLERAFGKEWVEWHRRTKRFIPWVF